MLPNVSIQSIIYQHHQEAGMKKTRERFKQYYRDLYSHYGKKLDEETFDEGSQVTYSELGDAMLSKCHELKKMNDVDMLVFSYWAYEYDPDHASCGAYLSHRYNLQCKMFDVCEQGTISPFMAIKIIHAYMKNTEINKAILLILEQTTIPRNKSDHDVVPANTGAIALVFEKNHSQSHRLISAEILLENEMMISGDKLVEKIIDEFLIQLNRKNPTKLYIRKHSYLWNIFTFFKNKLPSDMSINSFSAEPGCLQPWSSLSLAAPDKSNIIILDQDIESINTGILILESVGE